MGTKIRVQHTPGSERSKSWPSKGLSHSLRNLERLIGHELQLDHSHICAIPRGESILGLSNYAAICNTPIDMSKKPPKEMGMRLQIVNIPNRKPSIRHKRNSRRTQIRRRCHLPKDLRRLDYSKALPCKDRLDQIGLWVRVVWRFERGKTCLQFNYQTLS